jgi:hypothetical protein
VTLFAPYRRWLTGQVNKRESPMGSNRQPYAAMAKHMNGYPWCASFQVAGAMATGVRLPAGADTASCYANEIAYKRAGRLSSRPKVGAVFFVYFPSMSRVAHTGVVWKVSNDGRTIYTIEGNSNDVGAREGYEVCLRTRPAYRSVGSVGVRSYGMPFYEEDVLAGDLTRSQLQQISQAVWGLDDIPNQGGPKSNPDWTPRSMLSDLEATQDRHTADLEEIKSMLGALLTQQKAAAASKPKT